MPRFKIEYVANVYGECFITATTEEYAKKVFYEDEPDEYLNERMEDFEIMTIKEVI